LPEVFQAPEGASGRVSQAPEGASGRFEKWKTQRDARQKENKEWMRNRRHEMVV
jgi:hypothetical protein